MGSIPVKHRLFNPIRNTDTQACPSHNQASSTQKHKVKLLPVPDSLSFLQWTPSMQCLPPLWRTPCRAQLRWLLKAQLMSSTAHLSQPLSPRLRWSHPPTRMASLPPSTCSGTDTNLAYSSWAGEYGSVDIDFLGGGKSRSGRLAWDWTGRKENEEMNWRHQR